jgi:tetratricopeptide (TPR) repeat protein
LNGSARRAKACPKTPVAARQIRYDAGVTRLAVVSAVALLAGCSAGRDGSPPSPATGGRRVLLVGLDAADWAAIDPLVAAGRLPTFARLRAAGHAATLVATPPLLSPIIWTTIATGRPADEHGVLDFMVDLPGGGQGPVGSIHRKTAALWTLFSSRGRSVAVVGWWATWPAEDVRGTVVSDQLAPQLVRPDATLDAGLVSPASVGPRLLPLVVRAPDVPVDDLRRFVPVSDPDYRAALQQENASASRLYANRIAHLAAVVAGTRTHFAIAERLLRDERPDLTLVYLEAVDTVSHLFVKDAAHGRQAIEQAYVAVDDALGRLAAAASPDTWVVVCSDHGFHPATAGLTEDPAALAGPASAWHRPYGIAAAAEARALSADRPPAATAPPATTRLAPLDVAPTVLHAAGMPVDASMTGRVVTELVPPERAAAPPMRAAYSIPSPSPRAEPRAPGVDAAALSRLQALGYIGSRPSSLARQNLGEVLYRRGRLDAAERAFRRTVEAQPRNLGAWLWLARTQQAQGRTRDALQSWSEAVRLPEGPQAALLPALDAAIAAGLTAEAQRLVTAVTPTAPAAVLHTARAVLATARGGAAEAERELRIALRSDPSSFDALFRLFDLLHRQGRSGEALPPLRRAAAALPGSPRHAALLGEALLATGDAEAAGQQLTVALDLAPDSDAVRLDLARAQLAVKDSAGALATLQTASPSPDRSILMGAACAATGRWSESAAHYRDALGAGAATPELLNGLGWALHKQGRNGEAAEALRRSLALRADQPPIRELLRALGS